LTRAPGLVESTFSDYRNEGALLLPHKQARRIDGEEFMTITLESFEINPKVEDTLFKKAAGQ